MTQLIIPDTCINELTEIYKKYGMSQNMARASALLAATTFELHYLKNS